jgi:hypothetical protein
MEWLLVAAGVILVIVGLLDVFFTVFHYDGFGFLAAGLYYRAQDTDDPLSILAPHFPGGEHRGLRDASLGPAGAR